MACFSCTSLASLVQSFDHSSPQVRPLSGPCLIHSAQPWIPTKSLDPKLMFPCANRRRSCPITRPPNGPHCDPDPANLKAACKRGHRHTWRQRHQGAFRVCRKPLPSTTMDMNPLETGLLGCGCLCYIQFSQRVMPLSRAFKRTRNGARSSSSIRSLIHSQSVSGLVHSLHLQHP